MTDGTGGLREWRVAGGILVRNDQILLVENERRNGRRDWSTPGGVVDDGETFVSALTREVEEETGLVVLSWSGPVYRVEVTAPEHGFHLLVEAFVATAITGKIHVDDPDHIVVSARYCERDEAGALLADSARFVREPLLAHLEHDITDGRSFRYHIDGVGDEADVRRLDS